MNHARTAILPVLLALGLGVAYTWPLALAPATSVAWSPFTEGHVAALGLAARVPPWTTHVADAGWPSGVDFRPVLWPWSLVAVVAGHQLAYALCLLLTPALNVVGGVVCGRALGLDPRASAALGALLAVCPWTRTTLQNGQPEQAWLGLGAGLVATLVWCTPRRWIVLAPPLTFAAGVAAPHVTVASLVLFGTWALFGARPEPRRLLTTALAALGTAGVVAWHGAGLVSDSLFAPLGSLDDHLGPALKHSSLWWDLVAPARLPPGKGPWVVHLGYVGLPLLLVGLGAPRSARFALAAAVICLVLALGANGPLAPLGGALHPSAVPYRFTLGAVLALSVVAAHTRWAPWLVAVALAEALLVDPRPLPFETALARPDAASRALSEGSGPVLDLPVVSTTCRKVAGHYLVEAGRHRRPVPLVLRSGFDAYGDERPRMEAIDRALSSPSCAEELGPLLGDYRAVVAHRHASCLLRETQLACLRAVLGPGKEAREVYWWERAP